MRSASIVGLLLFILLASRANALEHVTSGPELDYQASVLRSSDDGARIMVFERLNASDFGDLWITRSTDDGKNWTVPVAIIATTANERHPAVVQTGSSQYALFYLKSAGSSYHLWRATSSDGEQFTEQNQLDLGWSSGSEINPRVIRHQDGTLTMSYQRLGGGGGVFVAQSTDGGVTWDQVQTQIASGAQLPRIAFREGDGLYLASYQVGGSPLQMYVKTTTDVRDWSAPRQDFAITGNNHDSLPVVMPDDAFVMFWIVERATSSTLWRDGRPMA